MTDEPIKEDPDDVSLEDFSILELFNMGGKMYGEYTEDSAVRDFLEMHPEANEADVRAELTREIEANDERMRPHRARIERERAQKVREVAGKEEPALNWAYAFVNGNGDEKSGDGWRYRGRGLIQLTGRRNYRIIGEELGLDLVNNPDLAIEHGNSIKIAIAFWKLNVDRKAAQRGDVRGATRRINPGLLGLEKRIKAFRSLGGNAR